VRISYHNRYALSVCAAAAFLAGCGGSQPPIGAPGAMPQSPAVAAHAKHGGSWMLPQAKGDALLYVVGQNPASVFVFSYPSDKLVGMLTHFSQADGECVDRAGNVFITDFGAGDVVEYAHGGNKRIKTLRESGSEPSSCAVDPVTGDLAVTNYPASGSVSVFIYADAKGKPKYYHDPEIGYVYSCGYDNKGNLFIVGSYPLAELRKNGKTITNLSMKGGTLDFATGIQWDGKYLAVGDNRSRRGELGSTEIARLSVSGSTATIEGHTHLKGAVAVFGFWIHNGTLIAPDGLGKSCDGDPGCVEFYPYPQGGEAIKTLPVHYPFAAAISVVK
jgi:hypothetical protein